METDHHRCSFYCVDGPCSPWEHATAAHKPTSKSTTGCPCGSTRFGLRNSVWPCGSWGLIVVSTFQFFECRFAVLHNVTEVFYLVGGIFGWVSDYFSIASSMSLSGQRQKTSRGLGLASSNIGYVSAASGELTFWLLDWRLAVPALHSALTERV